MLAHLVDIDVPFPAVPVPYQADCAPDCASATSADDQLNQGIQIPAKTKRVKIGAKNLLVWIAAKFCTW